MRKPGHLDFPMRARHEHTCKKRFSLISLSRNGLQTTLTITYITTHSVMDASPYAIIIKFSREEDGKGAILKLLQARNLRQVPK